MLTNQELRQLQEKELMEELSKSSRELLKARMEHSGGTLKETHRLVELKKHIARMQTIMGENMRAAPAKVQAAPAQTAKIQAAIARPAKVRVAKAKTVKAQKI